MSALLRQQRAVEPGGLSLPLKFLRSIRQSLLQRLLHDGHEFYPLSSNCVPGAEPEASH